MMSDKGQYLATGYKKAGILGMVSWLPVECIGCPIGAYRRFGPAVTAIVVTFVATTTFIVLRGAESATPSQGTVCTISGSRDVLTQTFKIIWKHTALILPLALTHATPLISSVCHRMPRQAFHTRLARIHCSTFHWVAYILRLAVVSVNVVLASNIFCIPQILFLRMAMLFYTYVPQTHNILPVLCYHQSPSKSIERCGRHFAKTA